MSNFSKRKKEARVRVTLMEQGAGRRPFPVLVKSNPEEDYRLKSGHYYRITAVDDSGKTHSGIMQKMSAGFNILAADRDSKLITHLFMEFGISHRPDWGLFRAYADSDSAPKFDSMEITVTELDEKEAESLRDEKRYPRIKDMNNK